MKTNRNTRLESFSHFFLDLLYNKNQTTKRKLNKCLQFPRSKKIHEKSALQIQTVKATAPSAWDLWQFIESVATTVCLHMWMQLFVENIQFQSISDSDEVRQHACDFIDNFVLLAYHFIA